jgi:hypothetical protein
MVAPVLSGGHIVCGQSPHTTRAPPCTDVTYVGGSGDIALGVGVGANALIGGSNNSIALQPFSIEGQVGVNLALGVAALTLVAAR